ncbi:acyltransferase, partial [Vibrio parahaemolyticus]
LALPLLLWNLAMAAMILAVQTAGLGLGWFPDLADAGISQWADHLVAFDGMPLDLPLYFLRDLLLCFVA